MSVSKKVAGLGEVDEMWAAAIKESGLNYVLSKDENEILNTEFDCILLDSREGGSTDRLKTLRSGKETPILSLVEDKVSRATLKDLKDNGASGFVSDKTPPEEVAIRLQAMVQAAQKDRNTGESRSSRRVWFQQLVEFSIFDKTYSSWSTTLSETGIFIRTSLSFPLYSVMKLKFKLWGEEEPFECDGVVVRQEVDHQIRGLGIMFQNLKGENVRRLESFFDVY